MKGRQDKSDRSNPFPDTKHGYAADDLWLADLPNDLAAISLSTDEVGPLHPEMMGCIEEMTTAEVGKTRHKHDEVGI